MSMSMSMSTSMGVSESEFGCEKQPMRIIAPYTYADVKNQKKDGPIFRHNTFGGSRHT